MFLQTVLNIPVKVVGICSCQYGRNRQLTQQQQQQPAKATKEEKVTFLPFLTLMAQAPFKNNNHLVRRTYWNQSNHSHSKSHWHGTLLVVWVTGSEDYVPISDSKYHRRVLYFCRHSIVEAAV
jgi:hypothetical protein